MALPEAESDYERTSKLAYKYSTLKRYAQSSADDNWFRAQNQLGLLQSTTTPVIEQLSSSVSRFSELIGRLLTIVTGISVGGTIIGAWLFVAYLKRIGAPIPPVDTVFLISISTVVLTLFSALLMMFISPFLIKFFEPSVQKIYPTLSYKVPHKEGGEFWWDYLMYHLPLFFLLLSLFMAIAFSEKAWTPRLALASPFLGVSLELLLLKRLSKYRQLCLTVYQLLPCLGLSGFSGLLSMLWVIVLGLPILEWLSNITNPGGNSISFLVCSVFLTILLVLHFFLSVVFSNRKVALRIVLPIACIGFVVLIGFTGPAYVGGEALRFFQSGGGVPVSVTLKSAQSKPESGPVTGCLILLTGSQVLLSSRPPGVGCRLAPSPEWDQVRARVAPVDLYERSDILKIKFVTDEAPGSRN